MTAISALQSRGLRVPQDVRVVGYDDIDAASHFNPTLSTVHQSIEEAGAVMVQALQDIMAGQTKDPLFLPTRLVLRESSS
jgi:DNA-binding LacI/PurR family transcriptional regulator